MPSTGLKGVSHGPRNNRLLAALPDESYRALLPFLERVDLRLGSVLYESGGPRRYVYFPTTSIVSLIEILEKSGHTAPIRAVVQTAGSAYQVKASVFKNEFDRSTALQQLLLRYTQALMTQMAQTAVCNRYHTVNQQFCRLLLLSLELGVRRVSVTEAAGRLQADGVIDYRRGRIKVLDRRRLEERVCECYGIVKNEYRRLLDQAADGAIRA
jgi:hypothetical protein